MLQSQILTQLLKSRDKYTFLVVSMLQSQILTQLLQNFWQIYSPSSLYALKSNLDTVASKLLTHIAHIICKDCSWKLGTYLYEKMFSWCFFIGLWTKQVDKNANFLEENKKDTHKKFSDLKPMLPNTGTTVGWNGTRLQFFQNCNHRSQQNMVTIWFKHLQKIQNFWKFGGCSSRIGPAMPISILCY